MSRSPASLATYGLLLGALALAACQRQPAAADPAARSSDASFQAPDASGWGRAGGLAYLESVRGGAAPTAPLPMVVLIHGLGDRPRADWLELVPSSVRARVIMPRAPERWGRGFGWFPYRVADDDPIVLAKHLDARAQQLAAALEIVRVQRPTRGAPIVGGFSQGGMLSFALAVRNPERYSFALPISGLLPQPLWPTRAPEGAARLPIRALHGTDDAVVPIAPARALVRQLKALGFDASLEEFPGLGHSFSMALQARVSDELRAAVRRIQARH